MNFSEVVAAVNSIVKRPDRIGDVRREVNAALNFFSSDLNATRDVEELLVPIVATEYTQAILLTGFPRFRKFQYIRRAGTKNYLKFLPAKKLYEKDCAYGDKYYIASNSLKISMTELASNLDVGYYVYPPVLTDALDNNSHWLLDSAWPVIYDRALGKILGTIGDSTAAQRHEGFAVAGWLAKRADLEAEGGQ
jgi:hypothetical protein